MYKRQDFTSSPIRSWLSLEMISLAERDGSPAGIAALTSADGRHLAMMPHPERSIFPWPVSYTHLDVYKRQIPRWQLWIDYFRELDTTLYLGRPGI